MRRYLQTLRFIAGLAGVLLAIVALLRVGETDQRLTDVREELLMVTQGIRQNDIGKISTRIEAFGTDLAKVSGDVRTLTSEVQGVRSEASSLAKELATLSTKVATMDSARLEDLTRRLSIVAEKLAQFEVRLAHLEDAAAKLAALSSQLEQVNQGLATVRAQVSAFDAEKVEPVAQRVSGLARDLSRLQERLANLEVEQTGALTELASWNLRIGVVDAEDLFMRVFLSQVAAERATLQAKAQEIQELQSKFTQGQIKPEVYQQRYARLQAESLQAQAAVNMSMLDKMIAAPGFANLRADLQNLRDQVTPLADQVENLVKQSRVTILNYTDFFNQVQQLQTAFQQVDQLLTQVAAMKILEAAQQVAQEQGYHLVLRTRDVVMYSQTPVVNLAREVEERLEIFFGPIP